MHSALSLSLHQMPAESCIVDGTTADGSVADRSYVSGLVAVESDAEPVAYALVRMRDSRSAIGRHSDACRGGFRDANAVFPGAVCVRWRPDRVVAAV